MSSDIDIVWTFAAKAVAAGYIEQTKTGFKITESGQAKIRELGAENEVGVQQVMVLTDYANKHN